MTISTGKPVPGESNPSDSGAATARRLGMTAHEIDRLAYLRRSDLPEAEFLATGMSGEDVVLAAMEPELRGSVLLTGVGGGLWRKLRPRRTDLWRTDLQGCSLGEFRLRLDFVHVPLPFFGLSEQPSLQDIAFSDEMRPFSVGGDYDHPIPRRIAEEGGVPRGTFATVKLATSATIHTQGAKSLAPATLGSIGHFAEAEGERAAFPRRYRVTRAHRLLVRIARRVHLELLAEPFERRRQRLVHFEPRIGTLLLRWAVSVVRPRYAAVAGFDGSDGAQPAAGAIPQHEDERVGTDGHDEPAVDE